MFSSCEFHTICQVLYQSMDNNDPSLPFMSIMIWFKRKKLVNMIISAVPKTSLSRARVFPFLRNFMQHVHFMNVPFLPQASWLLWHRSIAAETETMASLENRWERVIYFSLHKGYYHFVCIHWFYLFVSIG